MRRGAGGGICVGIVLFAASGGALAQPAKPTIEYPTSGSTTNLRVNPTIFFSAFSDPSAPTATQGDFEAEVATASGFGPSVVWRSHPGSGGGMAVSIDAKSGVFQGALDCRTGLELGGSYHVRVRQKGKTGGFGPFSDPIAFTTASYAGRKLYVHPSGADAGNCQNAATPCRSVSFAIGRAAPGDQILIAPGVYPTAAGQITFNDLPDRIWIRGADPQNRPVIKANFGTSGVSVFATLNGATEVILEDLIFEGQDNCCPAGTGNSYAIVFRGQPRRSSWINVAFRKGMSISGNLDATQPGAFDLLFSGCEFDGQPTNGPIPGYLNAGRTHTGFGDFNPKYFTVRDSTFDQHTDHMDLSRVDRLLFEDVSMTRGAIHPLRPLGVNRNWTLRRFFFGDAPEGVSFSAGASSGGPGTGAATIVNLSLENSTFLHSLTISDNAAEPGTIGTFVMRNNIFAGGGSPQFWVDDCIVFCPSGGDVVNRSTDRIDIDNNIFWRSDPLATLITFDGVTYTRRGTNSYDDWLATGFNANAPFALYNGTLKDSVDPRLTLVPMNNPSIQADPTPLPGSPAIDAGDPTAFVPEGGGARVDIGVVESPVGPFLQQSSPAAGETCGTLPSGLPMTLTLGDSQGDLDPASIAVQINGAPAAATVSGGGAQADISVPLPVTLPPTNIVTVDVTAADTASPAHVSTLRFCFTAAPPVPPNVTIP